MQRRLRDSSVEKFEELNELIKEVAGTTLQATYWRRFSDRHHIKEQPWVTKEIKEGIKKRKEINRSKRNTTNEVEKSVLEQEYLIQKNKVKRLVKDAITAYEKITKGIRESKNKSKAVWENINKLRKNERREEDDVHLYDVDNKTT